MQKIEIRLSKTKMYIMMAFAGFLLALGMFLIVHTIHPAHPNPYLAVTLKVIGAITVVLGIFGYITTKKIYTGKVGLLIDDNGITDNATGISVGFIPWENIKNVGEYEMMGSKMMLIYLHDTTKYLFIHTGFKRQMAQKTMSMYDTPVAISAGTLDISFEDLQRHIERAYKHYKK